MSKSKLIHLPRFDSNLSRQRFSRRHAYCFALIIIFIFILLIIIIFIIGGNNVCSYRFPAKKLVNSVVLNQSDPYVSFSGSVEGVSVTVGDSEVTDGHLAHLGLVAFVAQNWQNFSFFLLDRHSKAPKMAKIKIIVNKFILTILMELQIEMQWKNVLNQQSISLPLRN